MMLSPTRRSAAGSPGPAVGYRRRSHPWRAGLLCVMGLEGLDERLCPRATIRLSPPASFIFRNSGGQGRRYGAKRAVRVDPLFLCSLPTLAYAGEAITAMRTFLIRAIRKQAGDRAPPGGGDRVMCYIL